MEASVNIGNGTALLGTHRKSTVVSVKSSDATPVTYVVTDKEASECLTEQKDKKIETFDEMLLAVGAFGTFQRILFVTSWIFPLMWVYSYFTQFFITLTPNHWCRVPELGELDVEVRQNLSLPLETRDGLLRYSQCRMYNVNYTKVLLEGLSPDPSWPTTRCTHGWEYDLSFYPPTVSTELDWVCDDDWRPAFCQSTYFVGAILGTVIFGMLADAFGRLPILIVANALSGCAGLLTALTKSFNTFITCRFFVGLAYDTHYMMMYVILQEYMPPNMRTFAAQLPPAIFATLGNTTLPWIVFHLWNWRMVCVVFSSPMLLVILGVWFIPESVRWLLCKGRVDQTISILRKISRWNRTHVSEERFCSFRDSMKLQTKCEASKVPTFIELFRTPRLRMRMIILLIIWTIISNNFDCIVRLLPDFSVNKYVVWSAGSSTALLGDLMCILLFDRLGRRVYFFLLFLLSAGICFAIIMIPLAYTTVMFISLMLGRFMMTAQWNAGVQYCLELIPTRLRGQGNALIHIVGHTATFFSPYIVYMGNHSRSAAFSLLGSQCLVAMLLVPLLPETTGKTLPQTIDEGENFGRGNKYCNICCNRKKKYKECNVEMNKKTETASAEVCRNLLHTETTASVSRHC